MKIVFRVDASLEMGTGHVMRCLTLAKVLKENGADVEFICRKHEGNLINKIRLNGFNTHELELFKKVKFNHKLAHSHWLGATQQQDSDNCIDLFKTEKFDWLIVDHYALDEQWQKRLKPYYKKIMVIDDLADRKHQCDILLDQTFGRQLRDYSELTLEGCELLLGSQYALLRPEFAKWRSYSLKRRNKPEFKRLLINMGGTDNDNITESILDKLKACSLPNDINITIVMGVHAPHIESVKLKISTLPYKAKVKVNVENMAEIMANTDIAIGASGSTTWERCSLGLPTIQAITADNQLALANSLKKVGAIELITSAKSIESFFNKCNDKDSYINFVNIVKNITDGMGCKRVSCALLRKRN